VNKTVQVSIFKLAHRSLSDESFPEYLTCLSFPFRVNQHSAATIFTKLLVAIRSTTEYNSFCRSVKRHFITIIISVVQFVFKMAPVIFSPFSDVS